MNAKFRSYDLHCHSICSDGTKTPKELIDLAKKEHLHGISITDHDTVAAYTEELISYAKEQEIDLIIGVEFSTEYKKQGSSESIHILGYAIDKENQRLLDFCNSHKKRRIDRFYQIIEKLYLGGFDLRDITIPPSKEGSIGRPHIAMALIERGYAKDMPEVFKKFLGDRAPYFVSSSLPRIEETIAVIKMAGGKAILAHPILIKGRKVLKKVIAAYQFDGLECYYGNFQRDRIQYLIDICEPRKLLITGGSDYHGEHRTFVSLGSSFTTDENVRKLL